MTDPETPKARALLEAVQSDIARCTDCWAADAEFCGAHTASGAALRRADRPEARVAEGLTEWQEYAGTLSDALLAMGHHNAAHHQSPNEYDAESGLACSIQSCLANLPETRQPEPDRTATPSDLPATPNLVSPDRTAALVAQAVVDNVEWDEGGGCRYCVSSPHTDDCAYLAALSILAVTTEPAPVADEEACVCHGTYYCPENDVMHGYPEPSPVADGLVCGWVDADLNGYVCEFPADHLYHQHPDVGDFTGHPFTPTPPTGAA